MARPAPLRRPLFQTVELVVGETARVAVAKGSVVRVRLLSVDVTTDPLRSAVRSAGSASRLTARP